jgi:hypothetical protein
MNIKAAYRISGCRLDRNKDRLASFQIGDSVLSSFVLSSDDERVFLLRRYSALQGRVPNRSVFDAMVRRVRKVIKTAS